ncbi:uncharacterized protein LOC113253436 [Ursus arctos]|uniref:uncharacterized protein LOC113253436 n=1 Tax=Ursus arctos TaxID=9644 RepID=UPI000E6DAF3D|nr:uncharacterized protein LOC113253436 [Ursus arctos]
MMLEHKDIELLADVTSSRGRAHSRPLPAPGPSFSSGPPTASHLLQILPILRGGRPPAPLSEHLPLGGGHSPDPLHMCSPWRHTTDARGVSGPLRHQDRPHVPQRPVSWSVGVWHTLRMKRLCFLLITWGGTTQAPGKPAVTPNRPFPAKSAAALERRSGGRKTECRKMYNDGSTSVMAISAPLATDQSEDGKVPHGVQRDARMNWLSKTHKEKGFCPLPIFPECLRVAEATVVVLGPRDDKHEKRTKVARMLRQKYRKNLDLLRHG